MDGKPSDRNPHPTMFLKGYKVQSPKKRKPPMKRVFSHSESSEHTKTKRARKTTSNIPSGKTGQAQECVIITPVVNDHDYISCVDHHCDAFDDQSFTPVVNDHEYAATTAEGCARCSRPFNKLDCIEMLLRNCKMLELRISVMPKKLILRPTHQKRRDSQ